MRKDVILNMLNVILYLACAVLWFCNGLRDRDAFDFILALVWLAGAVIWTVRLFKEKKK